MKRRLVILCAASLAGACVLRAADGDIIASGAYAGTFQVNTADAAPFVAASAAEIAALPPIGYGKGETVTAQGIATVALVTSAMSASSCGSVRFSPGAGGSWTLINSEGETARILIPFSVYGDYGTLMAVTDGAFSPYVVDSLQTGPVRKVKDRVYPPVAYTGDDWVRNSSAASTLSFVSPLGGETSFNLTGTGATQFNFGQSGRWTVSLVMADGTTQEAIVGVPGGFIITFH